MKVTHAIILAGGRGERLQPLTSDRPKPMIEVAGYPLLHHNLLWLKQAGIETIIIACGYQNQVIQNYFGNGFKLGLNILYSIEEQPLGRGGAVKLASKLLTANDPGLVINGDMLTNLSLLNLFKTHEQSPVSATIVTVPLRSPYGIIEIDSSNQVTHFFEKPALPYLINAGIYVISNQVWSEFPDVGDHEKTLFPQLAQENRLRAYNFNGFWRTIDTMKDLADLRVEMESRANLSV